MASKCKKNIVHGGEGGIRTPDRGVSPYNGLANRRLQPLGHLSVGAARVHCISAWLFSGNGLPRWAGHVTGPVEAVSGEMCGDKD